MSALGQKRTVPRIRPMSALPPKADIVQHGGNVCFVPEADSCTAARALPAAGGYVGNPPRLNCLINCAVQVFVEQTSRPVPSCEFEVDSGAT